MACALAGVAGTAQAEGYDRERGEHRFERGEPTFERGEVGFFEATGAYGFQLGSTDYLPDGAFDDFKYPWVHGFAVGATSGVPLAKGLHLIGNYEYTQAWLADGDIEGVLDNVDGEISYHSAFIGLRVSRPVGAGRIRAEFAGGLIFPFEEELELDYGPALANLPEPITGTGTRTEKFDFGPGAYGMIGYEFPFDEFLYLSISVKLKAFQPDNHEEETEFDNFVTDFDVDQPEAITTEIDHGDGAARPIAEGIADARAHLGIGVRF